MEDNMIVDLFWQRNESAIDAADEKYGAYCRSIAHNILSNREDSEECLSDVYLAAWNSMPEARPQFLKGFLGKITRNLSLKKLRLRSAQKRGGSIVEYTLDELKDCVPQMNSPEAEVELNDLARIIDTFLRRLPEMERNVFLCRYWYFDSISDIAKRFGFGESKVKMMLLRTRNKLREVLEKEGVAL